MRSLLEQPLELLVGGVWLDRPVAQKRRLWLRRIVAGPRVRALPDRHVRAPEVDLLEDVIDGDDVRADAVTFEALARHAIELGGVVLAPRHTPRLLRLAHKVQGGADVSEIGLRVVVDVLVPSPVSGLTLSDSR